MGIPGILKEIGKGERTALGKLAIEHFERHNRPLRIAIDAAIWNFQTQSGQGGKNPALRTLFFRLLKLLALPVQPVFVYDGRNKPLTKRGKTVSRYHGTCVPNELSKVLVTKFAYPWHGAPGEAEAECALLQKKGIVDAVMSQDVDAIMFGAGITLRDWSKEGTRGNKGPTHVNVMDSTKLKEISGMDPKGMILVALLSGGDYDEAGVTGFGSALACEIARAGFAEDMIDLVQKKDWEGLNEWRERLEYELATNESGYFKRRHKTLKIPESFPDLKILSYYTSPAVSETEDLPALEAKWAEIWKSQIDIQALRAYTVDMFDWCWRSGARRFVRCLAQPLFQDRLRRGTVSMTSFTTDNISERRQHFINDGIPELRLGAVPAEVVGIDIEAEEENPEYAAEAADEDDEMVLEGLEEGDAPENLNGQPSILASPRKKRASPPWDPYTSEKWWIPETLLQLGLPEIVEDWHQLQRDIRADPKKSASRKAIKSGNNGKRIDMSMKAGAIRGFFTNVEKSSHRSQAVKGSMDKSQVREDPSDMRHSVTIEETSQQSVGFHVVSSMKSPLTVDHGAIDGEATIGGEPHGVTEPAPPSRNPMTNPYVSSNHEESLKDTVNLPPLSKHSYPSSTHSLSKNSVKPTKPVQLESMKRAQAEGTSLGSSFSAAIPIDSSPISTNEPPTPEPHVTLSQQEMSNVTQRSPQRAKVRQRRKQHSPPASPSRARRPIESFFTRSQSIDHIDEIANPPVVPEMPNDSLLSSEVSVALKANTKSTALARESLPGTWRAMDAPGQKDRRAPRISYIDLTDD